MSAWLDAIWIDRGIPPYPLQENCAAYSLVLPQGGAIGYVGAARTSFASSEFYGSGMYDAMTQSLIEDGQGVVCFPYLAFKNHPGIAPNHKLIYHYMGDPALDLYSNPIGNNITENTTWNRRIVLGNSITVESEATLTIEPGTDVILLNGSELLIEGRLIAEGTSNDRISIHGEVNSTSGRIRFLNSFGTAPYNILDYCDLYNLEIGLDCINSSVDVSNCSIQNTVNAIMNNGGSIQVESTTVQNASTGIFILDGACDLDDAIIEDCTLGVVYVRGTGDVSNSVIHNNSRYGAYIIDSNTRFTNNEIYNNDDGGLRFWRAERNRLRDNFIHDNGIGHNPNTPDWPGIWVLSGSVTMECNRLYQNQGPGLILYGQSVTSMADGNGMNRFENNSLARDEQGWDYGQLALVGGLPMIECGLNTFRDDDNEFWLIRSMYDDIPEVGWDATMNYWGDGHNIIDRISNSPIIEPMLDGVWECDLPYVPDCAYDDEYMRFRMGWTLEHEAQFNDALITYDLLVKDYPNGKYSKYAIERIGFCKKAAGFTPVQTRDYFLDLAADSTKDSTLVTICLANAAWCLVDMDDYTNALIELDALLDHSDHAYDRLYISLKQLLIELEQDGYELLGIGGDNSQRDRSTLDNESSSEFYRRFESITERLDSTIIAHIGISDRKSRDESLVPTEYALYQNYPNPFNPTTRIRYDLPEDVRVRISVFNTLGQFVAQLTDNMQAAGTYTILWDGKNAVGNDVASGMYIYQIEAGSFVDAKKMLLLK